MNKNSPIIKVTSLTEFQTVIGLISCTNLDYLALIGKLLSCSEKLRTRMNFWSPMLSVRVPNSELLKAKDLKLLIPEFQRLVTIANSTSFEETDYLKRIKINTRFDTSIFLHAAFLYVNALCSPYCKEMKKCMTLKLFAGCLSLSKMVLAPKMDKEKFAYIVGLSRTKLDKIETFLIQNVFGTDLCYGKKF